VHHGGHILSLIAFGGGLTGRVVGVTGLGRHGPAHLGGGAGKLLRPGTFWRLDRSWHRRLVVKMVGMMGMVVLVGRHHHGCTRMVRMGMDLGLRLGPRLLRSIRP
jgi:hypothetical protein